MERRDEMVVQIDSRTEITADTEVYKVREGGKSEVKSESKVS